MFKKTIMTIACLVALPVGVAHAASFDCMKPATQSAKIICGDKDLSAADDALNALLQTGMEPLSDAGKDSMRKSEANWYQYIDAACMRVQPIPGIADSGPVPCLRDEYKARRKQLMSPTIKTEDYTIMRVDLFGARAAPDNRGPFPGITTTKLAYPQFDAPSNAEQEAWNNYIAAQANARRAVTDSPDITDVVIDYDAPVVSSKMIVTVLNFSYFMHGAAHGSGGMTINTWLTGENRALKAEDVFGNKREWKPEVARLCFDALMSKNKTEHQVFDIDDPAKLEDKVSDPYRWTFSRDGLGIQFNYYEVGPRVAGQPKVTIPWRSLKVYLADDASDLIPDED